MRNVLAKAFSFALLLAALTSCQKEYSIEGYSLNGPNVPPTNPPTNPPINPPTNPPGNQTDCDLCEYMPICDGSTYTYVDNMFGTQNTRNVTLEYHRDTTINGVVFQKITDGVNPQPTYFNCTNGATRLISYNNVSSGGQNVSVADMVMIKANEAVGATWTAVIDQTPTQQAHYTFKILEKGISRTVAGTTYNDVIRVNQKMAAVVMGTSIPVSDSDYYYARDIGLIEVVIFNTMTGAQDGHTELQSYNIP